MSRKPFSEDAFWPTGKVGLCHQTAAPSVGNQAATLMEGHGFTISQERRKNVLARPGKLAAPQAPSATPRKVPRSVRGRCLSGSCKRASGHLLTWERWKREAGLVPHSARAHVSPQDRGRIWHRPEAEVPGRHSEASWRETSRVMVPRSCGSPL